MPQPQTCDLHDSSLADSLGRAKDEILAKLAAPEPSRWLDQHSRISMGPRSINWRYVAAAVLAKILAGEIRVDAQTLEAVTREIIVIGGPELAQDVIARSGSAVHS